MVDADTKMDIQKTLTSFEGSSSLLLSAKTGIGVEDLKTQLLEFVNTGALRNNETIVTNSRHYDALLKALEEILKYFSATAEEVGQYRALVALCRARVFC